MALTGATPARSRQLSAPPGSRRRKPPSSLTGRTSTHRAARTFRRHDEASVRELARELTINPNTVVRAYRELEIEKVITTQQGSGTFVSDRRPDVDGLERQRMLDQILTEMLARASAYGFTVDEVPISFRPRFEEVAPLRLDDLVEFIHQASKGSSSASNEAKRNQTPGR